MADPVVAEYAKAAKHYDEKWAFYVEATTRETLRRRLSAPLRGCLTSDAAPASSCGAFGRTFPTQYSPGSIRCRRCWTSRAKS